MDLKKLADKLEKDEEIIFNDDFFKYHVQFNDEGDIDFSIYSLTTTNKEIENVEVDPIDGGVWEIDGSIEQVLFNIINDGEILYKKINTSSLDM